MSTGPHTPPPPPSPGRAALAAIAGSYGQHARPISSTTRTLAYRAQIGCNRLTPRQRRRRDHKENRAFAATA